MMVRSAAKFGVKHRVKAETAQSRNHLAALHCVPMGMPNASPRVTRMEGAVCTTTCFFGIGKCVPYLVGVVLLGKRTGGTQLQCTDRRIHRPPRQDSWSKAQPMLGLEAAVVCTDDADTLELVAGGDTAAAENALVVVPEHMRRRCRPFRTGCSRPHMSYSS